MVLAPKGPSTIASLSVLAVLIISRSVVAETPIGTDDTTTPFNFISNVPDGRMEWG